MEAEDQIRLKSYSNRTSYSSEIKNFEDKKYKLPFFIYAIVGLILIIIVISLFYTINSEPNGNKISINQKTPIIDNSKGVREIEDTLIFDEFMFEKYKKEQNDFCDNPSKYYNKEIEDQISIANVSLLSRVFQMYIYNNSDIVSNEISYSESWESDQTNNLLTALLYYSSLYNLNPQDIYFLDLGANIGWYSFFVAKYGYNILSFEPSETNNYILKKNYCLNRELNVTFINKGLYNDEQKCDLYINKNNKGDGIVFCENNNQIPENLIKKEQVTLTKLSNYIQFLLNRNLALIKIDIEGAEEKAFEGGIKLLTKYHIPFIFLEFNPESLRQHGTDPKQFLKMFLKNGYRFPSYNFFDNDFLSIDEIMERSNGTTMNLYIIHGKMSRKYLNS